MAREELYLRFGDVWIDPGASTAVGVDGLAIRGVRSEGKRIDVVLADRVARSAPVEIALAAASGNPVHVRLDDKAEAVVRAGDVRARLG